MGYNERIIFSAASHIIFFVYPGSYLQSNYQLVHKNLLKEKKLLSKNVVSKVSLVDCTYRELEDASLCKYSFFCFLRVATALTFSEFRITLWSHFLACQKDGSKCWIRMKLCTICFTTVNSARKRS